MLIYFPVKTSMKCFTVESKANELIETKGGNLVPVPAFESQDDAEKWIQEQDTPELWHVTNFENSIFVDNHGHPLEEQTTKREPYQPIARAKNLEKPDYIYCVEPD